MIRTVTIPVGLLFVLLTSPSLASVAMPKGARVLDAECFFYNWPYPAISPDGKWIAYVSKGYVCLCDVNQPSPRRIVEVPNSWTWPGFVVTKDGSKLKGPFATLARGLPPDEYNRLNSQVKKTIYGIDWLDDSSGFIFDIYEFDAEKKEATSDVYLASLDGALKKIGHISPETHLRSIRAGILTRDRKFLVTPIEAAGSPRYRPLIWNVEENRPRATPFLYLMPSKTSARWLGIEKDTAQLVITNERFEVIKRFEEYKPKKSFGLRIDWSPDERFIIWRNQIGFDYFSNWEGFWMNLETGEKRLLEGHFMSERLFFTGSGGEFVRFGADGKRSKWISGDEVTGAHLTLLPEKTGKPVDLWRVENDPKTAELRSFENASLHPMLISADAQLFAFPIPRKGWKSPGLIWHILSRDRKLWRFPGEDKGEFIAPYDVIGFANSDKSVVAHDASRLFVLPLNTVLASENEVK